ncbi:hypothetical protein [Olivibacter domesticus]|nr:hypothetical protein [Olivibacter domesticus]
METIGRSSRNGGQQFHDQAGCRKKKEKRGTSAARLKKTKRRKNEI